MAFMDLLNENVYVAWIIIALISLLVIGIAIKFYVQRLMKKIKKSQKQKIKEEKKIVYKDRVLNSNLVEVKDFDKQKFYYEANNRDFFAKKGSFFLRLLDIRGYLDRRKRRKHPDEVVLIRMEMDNGQYKEFQVREDEKEGFKHKGKKYIFDLEAKYFVITSNMWAYDFHESLTIPIIRKIPVNELKRHMEHSNITEIENFMNPRTAERFVKSEIAQGILQGATIGRLFKIMLIIGIITVLGVGVDVLVDLYDSGIIQNLIEKK